MKRELMTLAGMLFCAGAMAQSPWYTQGNFAPETRLEYTIVNTLDVDRENCPVVISREDFPMPDVHELWVTVVDPALPPSPAPTKDMLDRQGGHLMREESNGHAIFHQLDDLDKDGIWDELFFQVNLKPKEERKIYIYIGQNDRGWNKHYTHANVGSYCRHLMPFWESENVGWKIWFANCVDVYGKRKPVLVSQRLYMDNLDGYGIAYENHDFGSDIQSVNHSFGGGALCLFEFKDQPGKASRPRFTPAHARLAPKSSFNAGQLSDTRYAYEVVVNGPLRSMVKIKGMNWDSGNGFYEYEQYYTAYAHQSYCTSKVVFTTFQPKLAGVLPGCGVKKKPREDNYVQRGGLLISSGPENIKDPEMIDDRDPWAVAFIGSALIVPDKYKPQYQLVTETSGGETFDNHTFRVVPDNNRTYEYMLVSAWSEGAVYNNKVDFNKYAEKTAVEYNNPLLSRFEKIDTKQ